MYHWVIGYLSALEGSRLAVEVQDEWMVVIWMRWSTTTRTGSLLVATLLMRRGLSRPPMARVERARR